MDKIQLLLIVSQPYRFQSRQFILPLIVPFFFLEDLVREVDSVFILEASALEPTAVMNNCDYFDFAPPHRVVEFFCNHINISDTICYTGSLIESVTILV